MRGTSIDRTTTRTVLTARLVIEGMSRRIIIPESTLGWRLRALVDVSVGSAKTLAVPPPLRRSVSAAPEELGSKLPRIRKKLFYMFFFPQIYGCKKLRLLLLCDQRHILCLLAGAREPAQPAPVSVA